MGGQVALCNIPYLVAINTKNIDVCIAFMNVNLGKFRTF
jgi:hypothetical protein